MSFFNAHPNNDASLLGARLVRFRCKPARKQTGGIASFWTFRELVVFPESGHPSPVTTLRTFDVNTISGVEILFRDLTEQAAL